MDRFWQLVSISVNTLKAYNKRIADMEAVIKYVEENKA